MPPSPPPPPVWFTNRTLHMLMFANLGLLFYLINNYEHGNPGLLDLGGFAVFVTGSVLLLREMERRGIN
jgi:hypothetical protein